MNLAQSIVLAVGSYLALGLLIGPACLMLLGPKRDHALAGSGRSVRFLLIPGSIAVWPALLAVWLGRGRRGGAT